MNNTPSLIEAIAAVERDHFRTVDDTGANPCAMLVLNYLRRQAGLPLISKDHLSKWDETVKRYVLPFDSQLLDNVNELASVLSNPDAVSDANTLRRAAALALSKEEPILSQYCLNKCYAVELRLAGNIAAALTHENICDRLYRQLRSAQRW